MPEQCQCTCHVPKNNRFVTETGYTGSCGNCVETHRLPEPTNETWRMENLNNILHKFNKELNYGESLAKTISPLERRAIKLKYSEQIEKIISEERKRAQSELVEKILINLKKQSKKKGDFDCETSREDVRAAAFQDSADVIEAVAQSLGLSIKE